MLAVLSSSDCQQATMRLLEELVPSLNCCKQRMQILEEVGRRLAPLHVSFFGSFVGVVFFSYQFILCSKVKKHLPTSSSIVICSLRRRQAGRKFFPGSDSEGAGFTAAAEGMNYWWSPPQTHARTHTPSPDLYPTKPPSQGTARGRKKPLMTVWVPQQKNVTDFQNTILSICDFFVSPTQCL